MALSQDIFNSIVDQYIDESEKRSRRDPWVFMPEGMHSGRFIMDGGVPTKFIRRACVHTFAMKIFEPCLNYLSEKDPEADIPSCGFCEIVNNPAYKETLQGMQRNQYDNLRPQYKTLVYFYLTKTNKSNDKFKPGNLYVLIGNAKLAQKYDNLVKTWSESPARRKVLYSSLNPEISGGIVEITYTKTNQGDVNLALMPMDEIDALPITSDDVKDLNEVWIPARYDKAQYDRSLRGLLSVLNKDTDYGGGAGPHTAKMQSGIVPLAQLPTPEGYILPKDCPGWGGYDAKLVNAEGDAVCLMCDYFMECHRVQESLKR